LVIATATTGMCATVRPLNGWSSHTLAAGVAVVVAGTILAASYLAFDVGGLRTYTLQTLRRRLPNLSAKEA
jgi:hypothetical protein